MKTMYKGLVNSPETTITNNIGTNDTIIYVLDPARVPSDLPNLMVLGTGTNAETIKVTAIEGNALTVERGFQGIAKDWLAGTIIARNFTEYDYAALVDNINELELTKETPDGAQAKADTAEGNAKTYASDLIGVLSNLKTTVKDKIVSAINELFDNLASHSADTTNPHNVTVAQIGAEPAFSKNTAFNKNFGTTAGTVCQGNDSRLSDARTPLAHTHTKSEVGLSNVDNTKQMPISGGTFTGVAVAQTNTSYTTRQLRNVIMSTANPSGGSNGDIWIKYK